MAEDLVSLYGVCIDDCETLAEDLVSLYGVCIDDCETLAEDLVSLYGVCIDDCETLAEDLVSLYGVCIDDCETLSEDLVSLYGVCIDDCETLAEDLVSLYGAAQTEPSNIAEDSEQSPSKKRCRECLSECDINRSDELNDISVEPCTDDLTSADNNSATCQSTPARAAPATSVSAEKRVNKENYAAITPPDAAATAAAGLKSPSDTFKSPPPPRRNVFARSRDSSVSRPRFDVNATKDKLSSPEPTVEVRSRSVTVSGHCGSQSLYAGFDDGDHLQAKHRRAVSLSLLIWFTLFRSYHFTTPILLICLKYRDVKVLRLVSVSRHLENIF